MPDDARAVNESFVPIWKRALGDETAFGELVAPQVGLEGSIFAAPIRGRQKVWAAIQAAGGITDSLRFTRETRAADRCYLEWELEALGQRFDGVSVIRFDDAGLIDNVALCHRPLAGVIAFSAEMGRRLGNSVGTDMFYQVPTRS